MLRNFIDHVHFIGVGGIGMSALAHIALDLGLKVSGSDVKVNENTQALMARGAMITAGHQRRNLVVSDSNRAVVVVSSAIPESNVEWQYANDLGVAVIARAAFLAEIFKMREGIAVAGTHGKTTVASLLTWCLVQLGENPTAVLGGRIQQSKAQEGVGDVDLKHGVVGAGRLMVAEADESDGSFELLHPTHMIVTNVELDHVDHWSGGEGEMQEAFHRFSSHTPFFGYRVLCGDDPGSATLASNIRERVYTFGFHERNNFRVRTLGQEGLGQEVEFLEGAKVVACRIPLMGEHNASNACGVFGMLRLLGFSPAGIVEVIESFPGVHRRMSLIASVKGQKIVVDDYGHHPTEVAAVFQSLRSAFPAHRLVCIFEGHRFSRLNAFFKEFVHELAGADHVYIAPIYPAGETQGEGPGQNELVEALRRTTDVSGFDVDENLLRMLGPKIRDEEPTLFLTLGAGQVTHLAPKIEKALLWNAECDEENIQSGAKHGQPRALNGALS